jgi:hypothetical protein
VGGAVRTRDSPSNPDPFDANCADLKGTEIMTNTTVKMGLISMIGSSLVAFSVPALSAPDPCLKVPPPVVCQRIKANSAPHMAGQDQLLKRPVQQLQFENERLVNSDAAVSQIAARLAQTHAVLHLVVQVDRGLSGKAAAIQARARADQLIEAFKAKGVPMSQIQVGLP